MNERAIFIEALDQDTPADRTAYLDGACAGDPALRARVDALLRSHEAAGEFPGKLAPQRLANEFAARESDGTRTGPSVPDGDEPLDFLEPSDKPGSIGRLGHYEVQEVVGRGGMGVVLKAFDERLHRVVAVKVMAAQLAASASARQRFTREARAAAAVTHDQIVTIHAVEETNGLPYIVMQYVDGMSLQDRIDQTGPLSLREILRIGMQTASGLAAAHAQGLVHRDVKPANILLENGVERVKLTDFGLARAADDASLTQSGVVAGTPSFMSPEQAEGKPVDQRSDLFSLGSVLYAMCTGHPPFRAGTSMGVLKRVCEDTPSPIIETNSEVPDWLAAVVEKLHAKDPAARFQSAEEVAELLGQHLAHVQHPSVVPLPAVVKSANEHAPARTQPRKRWVVAAAMLVAVFVALGTAEATGVTQVRATVTRIFVRVRMEDDSPAAVVPTAERGAFVLMASRGIAERKFDTLAEAVESAADADTIEVRGNGPFVTDQIEFRHPLTIRAGAGFRPVIADSPRVPDILDTALIAGTGRLWLEGLEFTCSWTRAIVQVSGPIAAANCRFMSHKQGSTCVVSDEDLHLRNCEVMAPRGAVVGFSCRSSSQPDVTNCVLVGSINLVEWDVVGGPTLKLTANTIISPDQSVFLHLLMRGTPILTDGSGKQLRLSATHNLICGARGVYSVLQGAEFKPQLSIPEAEVWLRNRVEWRAASNRYQLNFRQAMWVAVVGSSEHPTSVGSLADWNRFWGVKDTGSSEGVIRFEGGDLQAKSLANATKLTPEDFRLKWISPGYLAGKDGKDIGADVDLVGPGAAYERWKKTPEYQQWLKETGQLKK